MKGLQLLAFATGVAAWVTQRRGYPGEPIHQSIISSFDNLVVFGDSYTDESRLNYMIAHNDSGPPAGTLPPISNDTSGGGYTWDRWVAFYSGAKLYDYAVSGAVCSNSITHRYLASINADFPDILGYEVPAYLADVQYIDASTGTNTLYTDRQANNTVYAMWIGTNDLGINAFITDSNVAGTDLTSFTDCVFQAWDSLYQSGGRFFVLMNEAPLQLSPLYGLPGKGGLGDNKYWTDKSSQNLTEISYKMLEYTKAVNNIWDLQVPFEVLVAKRYPGASFAIYDVNCLMTDIYNNPTMFLNGTDGYTNVTGFYQHCNISGSDCVNQPGSKDGYLWYDELHPTERTDQIIAEHFVDVVMGNSSYATYWSG